MESMGVMAESYVRNWRDAVELPRGLVAQTRLFARNRLLDVLSRRAPPTPVNALRCLFCHYVFDDQLHAFEQLLQMLKGLGRFVDTPTALRMVRGEEKIDGPCFHLSFDDGLRNNFVNALPILSKLEVPCIFFVPPALMDADYAGAARYCLEITRYRGVIEMARWTDLREAIAAGFEIGSHSLSHARLSAVSSDSAQLHAEIAGSRELLEDQLGVPCRYIAWPYGTLDDIDAAGFAGFRAAGYEGAFGNFRAPVLPGKTDVLSIPRHHFEPQWPAPHVRYFSCGGWERAA